MATMEVSTTANQVFSAFSFIGFVLVTIPLPWHLQSWNTGTCLYMVWTSLSCLNWFINSIIWNNHVINVAPIWCEISIRIILATTMGMIAASLCINRRLYHISSVKSARITISEKRRAIMEDLAIGLGIPLISLPLVYVTQGHRFDIFEQVGCMPYVPNTVFAFLFVWIPPLIIGLVSGVYCVLTIRNFNKRRSQFKGNLSSNSINSNRYFRLMALASVDLCCTVPFACYYIYDNARMGVIPYKSWADLHSGYGEIDLIPALIWRNNYHLNLVLELSRGLSVACAFVFFGFFGFAEEARKNYRSMYASVTRRVGYSTTGSVGSSGATSTTGSKTPTSPSFGRGLFSFRKSSIPLTVSQQSTRTADSDTLASYQEKNSVYISTGSVFDDFKVQDFPPPASPQR